MFKALNKHQKILLAVLVVILVIVLCSAPYIFTAKELYYNFANAIIQGFLALIAFLGTVVVFKVELENRALEDLASQIKKNLAFYHELIGNVGLMTPTQVRDACQQVLDSRQDNGDRNLIEMYKKKMNETIESSLDAKEQMMNLATMVFLNTLLALVILLLSQQLANSWQVGAGLVVLSTVISTVSLLNGIQLLRRAIGYSVADL